MGLKKKTTIKAISAEKYKGRKIAFCVNTKSRDITMTEGAVFQAAACLTGLYLGKEGGSRGQRVNLNSNQIL